MRSKLVTLALAGAVGLSGAVLLAPGANAQSGSSVSSRLSSIKDALKGLVGDGTLTQSQADKVAQTLDTTLPQRGMGGRGHGGPGRFGGPGLGAGPQEVAGVLGITPDELRTQLEAGKTLTQIAAAKGIAKATLVDKLVALGEKALATGVTQGRLTQARADTVKARLRAEVTEHVDRAGGSGRGHLRGPDSHGPHGPGAADPDGDDPDGNDDGPAATTPSAQASPASYGA